MSWYWHIAGFDSTKPIFETKVKARCFTSSQVKALLMALAAKTGLGYDEIVGAYARRGSKVANDLLRVHRDGPRQVYTCGTNPHFIARIISDHDA